MTNGLAVHLRDAYGRDYWHNGTACSGYSFRGGSTTEHCLRTFKFGAVGCPAGYYWDSRSFDEYSKFHKLAVPEQLVWWEDE